MPGLRPPGFGEFKPVNSQEKKPFTYDNAKFKAETVLKKYAILEGDFTDLYGADNVEDDLSFVYKKKQDFAKGDKEKGLAEQAKLATILEAVICSQVNTAQWFGPYAKALKASDLDDFKHGVDEVLMVKPPQLAANYLGLGIDVTYGGSYMEAKFQRIKDEIDNGQLTTIKYLKAGDDRGERVNVPRLIIAVDGETVEALAQAWYADAPGLKDNVVKYQILKELVEQLQAFEQYAIRANQQVAAEVYAEARAVIEPIFATIQKQFANYKYELTDRAYKNMQEQLLMFS
jgi:hypothetical protein